MNYYNQSTYQGYDSTDDSEWIPMKVEEPCLPQFAFDPTWERAQSPEAHPISTETIEITQITEPRRRGRKRLRPQFGNKKTEDLDKFFFRKFRNYVKNNILLRKRLTEGKFWSWFLSRNSEPGLPNCHHRSYTIAYKKEVLVHQEFREQFGIWITGSGRDLMYEMFSPTLAQAYVQFAHEEILHFDAPVRMFIEEEPTRGQSDDEAEKFISEVLAF